MKSFEECLLEVKQEASAKRLERYKKRIQRERAALSRRAAMGIFLVCLFAVLAVLLLTTGTASMDAPGPKAIYIEDAAPETDENQLIEAALIGYAEDHGNVLRSCRVTWYTASVEECGNADGITATGFRVIEGATIGVDPDVIPLLSDVCVEWQDGTREWYVATDTGVTGAAVDIYCADRERASANGVKRATVYWIPPGAIT